MARYSPYDNLPPAGGRPDLLVTGAVHDPGSWSGAGQVGGRRCARPTRSGRRAACSASRPVPAPTSARRGGSRHLAYEAEVYAWLLDVLAATADG